MTNKPSAPHLNMPQIFSVGFNEFSDDYFLINHVILIFKFYICIILEAMATWYRIFKKQIKIELKILRQKSTNADATKDLIYQKCSIFIEHNIYTVERVDVE